MSRLSLALIAAVLAVGFGSVQLAQSQTETAARRANRALAKAKRAAMTPEEKAKRQGRARREAEGDDAGRKAKLKEERAAKKTANAAKKAKRQECVAKGKQDKLKGPKLREFVQTCVERLMRLTRRVIPGP